MKEVSRMFVRSNMLYSLLLVLNVTKVYITLQSISAGELSIPEDIISPVVSMSENTWFISKLIIIVC